jgi:DNA-directed RNA polymerase specialized sigma24 family protein
MLSEPDAQILLASLFTDSRVAPSDVFDATLDELADWLLRRYPRADRDDLRQAAIDAVMDLVQHPHRFDETRGNLRGYLRRSAECDFRNLFRKERRHRHAPLEDVELRPDAGNYLGREDDPARRMVRAEEAAEAATAVAAVADRCHGPERQVMELMRQGERRNAVYAAVLGIADWPRAERDDEIKRVKDRLKKRLRRSGGGP